MRMKLRNTIVQTIDVPKTCSPPTVERMLGTLHLDVAMCWGCGEKALPCSCLILFDSLFIPCVVFHLSAGSDMASGQKVEGPVLATVGRLELIAQAELPLVLQLQPDNCLPQGAAVLADHTQRGTWGGGQGVKGQMESGKSPHSHCCATCITEEAS